VRAGVKSPSGRATMRAELLDPAWSLVTRVPEWHWVRIIRLFPDTDVTRLVVRNRIASPGKGPAAMILRRLISEPGGMIMERKMLLGIKERAGGANAELWPARG